jgi:hypothetical protein
LRDIRGFTSVEIDDIVGTQTITVGLEANLTGQSLKVTRLQSENQEEKGSRIVEERVLRVVERIPSKRIGSELERVKS